MSSESEAHHERHIIVRLDDAQAIAEVLRASGAALPDRVLRFVERVESETGADIVELVERLTAVGPCEACVIEGQTQYCSCWSAQKQGRRLRRLIERADGLRDVEAPQDAASDPQP